VIGRKPAVRRAMRAAACALLLVAAAAVSAAPASTYAEPASRPPVVLTLDDATRMAQERSKDLSDLDRTLARLRIQREDLVDVSESLGKRLEGLESFRALHEKMLSGGLDGVDAIRYQYYQMQWGFTPPTFEPDELFHMFIKNRDFPHEQVRVTMENLERSRETAAAGLALQTRALFDQWFALDDQRLLLETTLADLRERKREAERKAENGGATEWELFELDTDIAKQELARERLLRDLENVETSVKSLAGIPLDREARLLPYEAEELEMQLEDEARYVERAEAERNDVENARNVYANKKREWEIVGTYLTDPDDFDRMQAENGLQEAEYELERTRLQTRSEVQRAYTTAAREALERDVARERLALAERQLEQANASVASGAATALEADAAETGRLQASLGLRQAEREYAMAVYRLELAVDTGPAANFNQGSN